jgi:hypothetical protein
LYNSNMQQIKSLQSNGSSNMQIDFNELPSGIYFCKVIYLDNATTVKKVVLIK